MNDLVREFQSYPGMVVKMLSYKREIKASRVSIGKGKEHYFLHFAPHVKKHPEVIMYIHGGGWNSKSPKTFEYVGQRMAQEGYECIILGYRKVPHVHYNEIISDVAQTYKAALHYLKNRGIDASRVIIMGSSAGAHLGSILVYDKELHKQFKICARRFVGFVGIAGMYCFDGKMDWSIKQLVTDLFEKNQNWKEGEPYSKLDLLTPEDKAELSIPMYLIHSEHDGVIDIKQTLVFARKAMELNIPVTFYRVTDAKNTHTNYCAGVFYEDLAKSRTLQTIFNYLGQVSTDME